MLKYFKKSDSGGVPPNKGNIPSPISNNSTNTNQNVNQFNANQNSNNLASSGSGSTSQTVTKLPAYLFIILGLITTLLAVTIVLALSSSYFGAWKVICLLHTLLTIFAGLKFIFSFFGLYLVKTRRKISDNGFPVYLYLLLITMTFFGLLAVLTLSSIKHSTVSSDLESTNLEGSNYVAQSILQHFSDNEEIPSWMEEMHSKKNCCGILGPRDWKKFLYPPDKMPYEDVPQSCCVNATRGCNIFGSPELTFADTKSSKKESEDANLDNLENSENKKPQNLPNWFHHEGCKQHLESLLKWILMLIICASSILAICNLLMILSFSWLIFGTIDNSNKNGRNNVAMMDQGMQSIDSFNNITPLPKASTVEDSTATDDLPQIQQDMQMQIRLGSTDDGFKDRVVINNFDSNMGSFDDLQASGPGSPMTSPPAVTVGVTTVSKREKKKFWNRNSSV